MSSRSAGGDTRSRISAGTCGTTSSSGSSSEPCGSRRAISACGSASSSCGNWSAISSQRTRTRPSLSCGTTRRSGMSRETPGRSVLLSPSRARTNISTGSWSATRPNGTRIILSEALNGESTNAGVAGSTAASDGDG